MYKSNASAICLAVTITIISLLIISGPANAFILGLNADKSHVDAGEYVTFDVSLKIESADGIADVQKLILALNGPTNRECIFDVNGNKISGNLCENIIAINKIDTTTHNYGYAYGYGYRYGYGYSNGELKYQIIIDTEGFYAGSYNPILKIFIGDEIHTQIGNQLTINQATTSNGENGASRDDNLIKPENEDNTISLTPGSEFDFTYQDYSHKLTLDNLNEDSVDLTIYSDPQAVNLAIPTPAGVDLNEDNQQDMELNLWYVGKDSATINVNSDEPIRFTENKPKETQEIISLGAEQINFIKENSITKNNFGLSNLLFGNSLINYILLITNAIVLLFIVVAFILRRR